MECALGGAPERFGALSADREVINLVALGFTGSPGIPSVIGPLNVSDARVGVSQPVIDSQGLFHLREANHDLTTITMAPIAREAIGQRDEPVQPDAEPGRRHRHRLRHDHAGPPPRLPHRRFDEPHQPVRVDQRERPGEPARRLHRARRGCRAAVQRAYAAAAGMLARQAATLSFDLFWILGTFFLAMIPLLFFMRRPEQVEVAMAGE